MDVTTPDKALLKLLWDMVAANGRPARVSFEELVVRVRELNNAGIPVYPVVDEPGLRGALRADADLLALWGLADVTAEGAELTGAGELIGGTLRFPAWTDPLMNWTENGNHSPPLGQTH